MHPALDVSLKDKACAKELVAHMLIVLSLDIFLSHHHIFSVTNFTDAYYIEMLSSWIHC